MALQIITTIGNQQVYLDLYDDQPLLLNFSFAEIQNITAKNSAFSQSFQLPGTKSNNEVFNYYYDISSIPFSFNPNQKFPAILTWDGQEVLQGNMRLENAVVVNDEVIYNTVFYNQVGDLAANIGDQFLRDLNLSGLSYPYELTVIPFCQLDPNLYALSGGIYTTDYSYQNGKTWWGLYNIGYNYISGNSVNVLSTPLVQFSEITGTTYTPKYGYMDFSGTPVNDFYFKPTIQVKELYSQIVEQAGYKINSAFFETEYFKRYYMPLKFLDDSVYPANAVPVCYKLTGQTWINNYLSPNYFYILSNSGVTCDNLGFASTASTLFDAGNITIPSLYTGVYNWKFTYTVKSNDSIEEIQKRCIISPNAAYVELYFWNSPFTSTPTLLKKTSLCVTPITNITNQVQVEYTTTLNITGASQFRFFFKAERANVENLTVEIIDPRPRFLISGQTIDFSLEFPENDYKQIDFITSINRYFNLVVVPDPDQPETVIIEPMIDYIGKGQVLDWTTKVDRSSPLTITPTSAFINGTYEFEFKLDQDYANQNYQKASNRIFGTRKEKLNIDYKDAVTKFDYMFGSPLDITILPVIQNMITLSSFSKINSQDSGGQVIQNFLPFKILPRLVFRGLTLPNDNYGYVGGTTNPFQLWSHKEIGNQITEDRFTLTNRFNTYPFNYSGFSHYLNFQGYDKTTILPEEFMFPTALDLYKIYYEDYVLDLTSEENKIVSGKIYLTPWEIKQLRYDEKILIDNTYYRINKIDNYNLLEPSLCNIELIKLTREYTPHPILYYDLTSCSGGTTYHSNSDLMFNLYAYIGNYVNLYDDNINYLGCYFVQQGQFNTGYTYQHFYIGSAYTSNHVGVFDNCFCTGRTAFDIVQNGLVDNQVTPTPTPSITPSPTPTPGVPPVTPTPTPSTQPCFQYQVVPNFGQDLEYYDCFGNLQIVSVPGGVPYNIACAQVGTVSVSGTITQGAPC